jgi:hypothetical protein
MPRREHATNYCFLLLNDDKGCLKIKCAHTLGLVR